MLATFLDGYEVATSPPDNRRSDRKHVVLKSIGSFPRPGVLGLVANPAGWSYPEQTGSSGNERGGARPSCSEPPPGQGDRWDRGSIRAADRPCCSPAEYRRRLAGSPKMAGYSRQPRARVQRSSSRRSSSTVMSWCRATLFRMLDSVLALIGSVQRDHLVMFTVDLRRDPQVGASLSHGVVTQASKRRSQHRAADVAGQLHATRTSSRTKCNRMTLGRGMSSSK